jgi:hypothetical protein
LGTVFRVEALVEERTALLKLAEEPQITSQENRQQALKLAAAGDEITRPQLRQLILLLVEKVETPVYVEGHYVREKAKTGLRRFARVTLKEPIGTGERVFLAAIYTSRYKGEKDAPFPCP